MIVGLQFKIHLHCIGWLVSFAFSSKSNEEFFIILVQIEYRQNLKLVRFFFCVIIMVIPSVLCFPSFLTISYRFLWCFRMFSLASLQSLQVFLLFPLSVSPVSDFGFCVKQHQYYFSSFMVDFALVFLHLVGSHNNLNWERHN